MKRTNFFPAAFGLATLALTGCSSELPVNKGPEVYENDDIRYVRISIANPPSTRAEFEVGSDEENLVKDAYFIFYDRDGNVVGSNSIVQVSSDDEISFDPNTGTPTPSVGKIATTVVQLQIPKGSKAPAYVMAFLNPVDYSEVSTKDNMYDLRDSKRNNYKCDHGCFAMNNSAYYGFNPISGESNVKILGAPVNAEQLYPTEAEATNASASTIDIYVERYAAKVIFELNQNNIDDQTIGKDDNTYVLTYVPDFWTVNADAPNMYASKRFENSDKDKDLIPSYDDVQEMLGTWTTWNAPDLHRSYWACSPGYYATEFPAVSDDVIDKAGEGSTGAGIAVGDYALKYYSYNQITNKEGQAIKVGMPVIKNGSNNKYVLENTMGKDAFKCANPKAAAPSVLIVGHYDLKKGNTPIKYDAGFCLYADGLFYIDNVPDADPTAKTIKQALMNRNGILAIDDQGTLLTYENAANAIRNCFEVVHPSADVRGTQKLPHRYVTLQLKKELNQTQLTGLYYKPAGSDTWSQIKANNNQTLEEVITSINKLLWAQLGNARIYTQNLGYFSIPIQHLGITENIEADEEKKPIGKDGSVNWPNVRVGDFGLVRNHVYSIKVSSIQGLASGIDNPDNPLVPAMDENDYWVKYKVNILNWRVVPVQGGIILK